jgi:Ca-activated chloride channel homolog
MKKLVFVLIFIGFPILINAQQERKFIRQGNKLYDQSKFTDAEESYRKALEKKPQSIEANYNVGNVLYKQNKFLDAANKYSSLTNSTEDKKEKSYIYYNLGNSYLQSKKLDESIKSYKESLKLNPTDKETKYNLAYAQRMLMQQQQQQKNQQNNKQKQDKNNKDQQNQQKNQQNKKDENQKQKQDQSLKSISQEDANRILEAMQNDEKELQKKMKLQKVQQEKGKTLKNW